jgi:hypothetical protein
MNYLQLTNDFITESGIGDPIGSVINQFDEYQQAITWIKDAWIEIQGTRTWGFRWAEGSFATQANQATYNRVTDLAIGSGADFSLQDFFIAPNTLNTIQLSPLNSINYRQIQSKIRQEGSTGKPTLLAERPDGLLSLYPIPDASYVIQYEYFKEPQILTADLDTPYMPAKFHKIIVWAALAKYAREQGGEWGELYQAATRNYKAFFSTLLNHQTGDVRITSEFS